MKDDKYHFPTLRQAEIWAALDTNGATLTDRWTYEDRDSQEAFVVLGFEREEDNRKMLRTVWMVPPGYRTDEPPRPWPLYRLPELSRGGQIYVCQSEALADRVRATGLLATTSAHGAGAVHKTDFAPLAGREAVLLPNNNEDGRLYARRATERMTRQSPPAEVRILALPGLGMNGTVGDFIDMKYPRELRSIGSDIADLAELTPEYWQLPPGGPGRRRLAGPAVPTPMAEAPLLEMKWLWPGTITAGRLNLLMGATGAGQSLLGADLAARVSAGKAWPDGSGLAPRGSVLLLAGPERISDTIRPALAGAGADMSRIITLAGLERETAGRAVVAALRRAIEREPDMRLVVIDPLSAHFTGNLCLALAELAMLAAETRLAIALIGTLNRRTAGLARLRSAGGHTLAAASSAWLLMPDRREPDRRLLLPIKGSAAVGAAGPRRQALACRIASGALVWEPGLADVPVGELLSDGRARRAPGFPPVKQRAAARWLRERLARGQGLSLQSEAEAAGLSWMTVRRALADIGAVSERCPRTGRFRWRLGQGPGKA